MSDNFEQKEFEVLCKEHRKYIEEIRFRWLPNNQIESTRVYEIMYPHEQERVHQKISEWEKYITPISEAWWKERGYGVVWPENNTDPVGYYRLKDT